MFQRDWIQQFPGLLPSRQLPIQQESEPLCVVAFQQVSDDAALAVRQKVLRRLGAKVLVLAADVFDASIEHGCSILLLSRSPQWPW